jgi:class 3 adenylate cyclase/tetratricopeptide (TPR) repeat protein
VEADRSLATVLFTDIVGSTERAAELGDHGWRELLHDHHALVRREIQRFGGHEVGTAGDGFLAAFDRPARAIRCACVIREAVRDLGLEIRGGLHMGEVEGEGGDLGGIAVHIGARVAALAGPGEVLVSSTVREAVTGSGFGFEDRGVHALKGVPGEWHLFAVSKLPAAALEEEVTAPAPRDVWSRVRRARLLRVLAVFLGTSFLVLQLVDLFIDKLGLPDWFFPGAVVLLVIGLPIILATALVQSAPGASPGASLAAGALGPGATRSRRPPVAPTSAAEARAAARHWLTWRKAILGGVLAFASLGFVVTAYMVTRALGIGPAGSLVAAGVLDERDRVLIADFENHTGDSLLGAVVTEAFRVDLAQSPLVTVVQPASVRSALERMQRDPAAALDPALAREVAVREGIKAVVAGDIGTAGTGLVLSTELVNAGSGEVLASHRETAADSTQILGAIDRLSGRLRERIGESLKTIRGNEPLDQVTTASLEALRMYSQAIRAIDQGDFRKGMALLEEAVAIDTAFAMAWRKLGIELGNLQEEPARAAAALRKAFEHRDRLTDRERYLTLGSYYYRVTGERDKAITAYQTLLDTYPDDSWALNNLGLLYYELRDYERSEDLYRRAVELDSSSSTSFGNVVENQMVLGRLDDARATLARFRDRFPEHPRGRMVGAELAALEGDYGAAEGYLRELRESRREDLGLRAGTSFGLADLARLRGRLAEAERHVRDAMAANEERGLPAGYLWGAIALANQYLWFTEAPAEALREVEEALALHPLRSFDPLDRPYIELARFLAEAGRPARASSLLAEFEAQVPAELRRLAEDGRHGVLGSVALTEGRPEEAIAEFRLSEEKSVCPVCRLPDLARAYDAAGQPDSARVVYERYLGTPWSRRTLIDSVFLARTYERLGELYAGRGESQKAIEYYKKLVELWKDADPELQPRVEAARQAIRALTPIRREAG